jgi:hypothetical protein
MTIGYLATKYNKQNQQMHTKVHIVMQCHRHLRSVVFPVHALGTLEEASVAHKALRWLLVRTDHFI